MGKDNRPWLGAFRTPFADATSTAMTAAKIVNRYAETGRPIPVTLWTLQRIECDRMIDKYHRAGGAAVAGIIRAIDVLDMHRPVDAAPMPIA